MKSNIKYNEKVDMPHIKKGDLYGGKYQLVSSLGNGGYGCVWKCIDLSDNNHEWAIKILPHNHVQANSLQRFRDEIKIMKNYSRDNNLIMPIIDYSDIPSSYSAEEHTQIYYVMPLAQNDGRALLREGNIQKRIAAINDIFEVLEYLHSNNIAHRDIKLQNILLYNDRYILSDYGLVTYQNKKEITQWREPVGPFLNFDPLASFSHAIPEHLRQQIDIYEFAKVVWMLLSLDTEISFRGQYSHCGIESIRRYLPQYSCCKLDKILEACTSLDITERLDIFAMHQRFNEWWEENQDDAKIKDLKWEDLIFRIFPEHTPASALWDTEESVITLLNIFINYQNCFSCSSPGDEDADINILGRRVRRAKGYMIEFNNNMFDIKLNNQPYLRLSRLT